MTFGALFKGACFLPRKRSSMIYMLYCISSIISFLIDSAEYLCIFKRELEDVIYDTKKGKFIIKDLEKEIETAKLNKKRKRQRLEKEKNLEYQNEEIKKQEIMKGKVKNIMKEDLYDLKKEESDEDENAKTKKKKISEKEEKKIKIKTMIDSHGKKTSHYVKYSGDEYRSKKAKGDKIIQGKYEPFAYIQLNPKSLNNKGERENAKIWENLMKNDKK